MAIEERRAATSKSCMGCISQVFAVTDAESDCKHQLDFALQYISEKRGVVVYLSQEGWGRSQ